MDNVGAAAVRVTTTAASEISVSSHLFTVKGYSSTRGIGVDWYIESPAFDAAGYRWSIMFFPDGADHDAEGFISIFVKLVSEASSAVTVLYGFSLVDPTGAPPAREASKKPNVAAFRPSGGARGVSCFMERHTFEASPYLVDNRFTIKCVVGAVQGRAGTVAPPASELRLRFERLLVDDRTDDDAWSNSNDDGRSGADVWSDDGGGSSAGASD